MKSTFDQTTGESGDHTCLDTIRMSKQERRQAYESLRRGELIGDLLFRAADDMHTLLGGFERAAASLAAGVKAMFAKPVNH